MDSSTTVVVVVVIVIVAMTMRRSDWRALSLTLGWEMRGLTGTARRRLERGTHHVRLHGHDERILAVGDADVEDIGLGGRLIAIDVDESTSLLLGATLLSVLVANLGVIFARSHVFLPYDVHTSKHSVEGKAVV